VVPSILSRFRVDLLLLLVAASWGSTYLVAKELVSDDGSVVALLASRMTLAAAALAVVVALRRDRITPTEWRVGVILGALLAAVFALETFGIAHTSATNAGLIISLTIVFTPLLDSVVRRRRLPRFFLLACVVAVLGVALLAGNGSLRPPALGDLLILAAAVVRAIHVTTMHSLSAGRPLDSLRLTTVQLGTCAAVFALASPFCGVPIPAYLAGLDLGGAALFLYLVLACTVFAFLVQTWAVRRTSPSRVSLLLGTEPVWAAVVGVTIANDVLTPPGLLGVVLILAGTAWGRILSGAHLSRDPPGRKTGAMTAAFATDLAHELEEVTEHWTPRVVGRVNDQYVKVAKLLGELVWHAHENEDEMFLVLSGRLRIQIEGQADVELGPGQFSVVPRGVRHNPVAEDEVHIALIETVTTAHTGDVIVPGTVPIERQVGTFD
jgi:drug/metabolite transporter (DMT)-like permease/mannose-6-phosphate isomerase-like protein (cupin superfamily)